MSGIFVENKLYKKILFYSIIVISKKNVKNVRKLVRMLVTFITFV
jgi:hypothetical protein